MEQFEGSGTHSPSATASPSCEDALRRIVAEAPIGIFHTTQDGRFLDGNRYVASALGYESFEELTRSLGECSIAEALCPDPQEWSRIARRLEESAGDWVNSDVLIRRRDGTILTGDLHVRLIPEYGGFSPAMEGFVREVTGLRRLEAERDRLLHALGERVKELACLQGLNEILLDGSIGLTEVMDRVAALFPPAMQFPGATGARVLWGDRVWRAGRREKALHTLREALPEVDGAGGAIEVFYVEDTPGPVGEPFLAEEQTLLRIVAHRLSANIHLRHYQSALEESEERLRLLSDRIPLGMVYQIEVGPDVRSRTFTFLSAGVERLHGVTYAEAMRDASAIYGQVLEEDRPRLAEEEAACISAMADFRTEFRIRRPSGEIRWLLASSSPRTLEDGRVLWDGIEVDITDQRRMQEELEVRARESEVLQSLTSKVNEAVLMEDVLDHIFAALQRVVPFDQLWLPEFDPSTGALKALHSRGEGAPGLGRPCDLKRDECARCVAGDAELVPDVRSKAAAGLDCGILRDLRSSGMLACIRAPLSVGGAISGVLVLAAGREGMLGEEHLGILRQVAAQLAVILEKSRLYEELLRQVEMKDRTLGGVAHDLRHPLGALMLYLSLLDGAGETRRGTDAETALAGMRAACETMTRLINDLLDFSSMEKGLLGLEAREVEPVAFTAALLPDYDLAARRKALVLETELPAPMGPVRMDPQRFRQVLDNLISNAVKYSVPGGAIRLSLSETGNSVRWRVEDRGRGIAPEDREGIFRPFFKGRRRPPSDERSNGLGLALSKRIVEIHGGWIGFECPTEGGTAFSVSLPRATGV